MKRSALLVAISVCAIEALLAQTIDPWIVRDFRVEGAQRISEGTIYNYLPINIGDTLDDQLVREAIRAIYATGFFREVEFRRDGSTLVLAVLERPSIDEFTIEGNEDIETEQLESSMREVGLAPGKVFDRSVLEEVTQALTEQYYSQGKYAVIIDTPVEILPDNRVKVGIEIQEGERAKIRQVNVVGNKSFNDEEILDEFELQTGNFLSFIKKDDRYSKQALEGDLEALRSFYMDRGFADFRWDSVQVAISPDKRDIFITINIAEGERYVISDVKLVGEMVVPEEDLRSLILVKPGQTFSQQLLAATEEFMSLRLGQDGYAMAQIQAVPELTEQTKEASITFFVDAQSRVYVRRINFLGADSVNDKVFRREMRQLEGAYLSNDLVERSKVRLQRLPYVESAEYETIPVQGTPDLVDVDFTIEEGLPGQFGGGIGYSATYGLMLNGNFIHSNFMGNGSRIGLELNGGDYFKSYNLNFSDPYRNIDGLQRTLSFSYRDITQFTSASSDFSTTTLTSGIQWGYPISEFQTLSFGFAYQEAEMLTSSWSSAQSMEWVRNNGNSFVVDGYTTFYGTKVQSLELTTGWRFDSRNRFLFPTQGTQFGLSLNATVPGSDVEYYVASLNFTKYIPIRGPWLFKINSTLSLGEGYNETTAIPPFRNFYGGGPGTVRGFKESYMGPVDSFRNPYGGNMLFASQFELVIPTPEKFSGSTRIALFYDIGNVFSTNSISFFDKLGDPISYDFEYDNLKRSVGVGVEWLAPMGLLQFSYALPLNERKETDRFYGDEIEQFQFSIGQAF
jgi:outer membrane protein insertion porin family